jgi:N-acetylglucosamine-6-phosphate deacetylase
MITATGAGSTGAEASGATTGATALVVAFSPCVPMPPAVPWLTNVRLPLERACGHGRQRLWRVAVDDAGVIDALEPLDAGSQAAGIDWGGDWLSPMGVDLQINGGLGLPFPELTPDDLPRLEQLLEHLWSDGVEAICPTLVTCGVEPLRQALEVLAEARLRHRPGRCRLLGAHLEGPFLAYERRGAHPPEHLAAPGLQALEDRIGGFSGGAGWEDAADIALVTLAPELEGSAEVIAALRRRRR